nr:GntR family transcriptional regulator [Streptomyces sp. DSM 41633]
MSPASHGDAGARTESASGPRSGPMPMPDPASAPGPRLPPVDRPQPPAFAPDSLVLNRKLPLWYQVSQSLRASILGRPQDASPRLPTEEQLAAHYGV